jgi:hypothetical protein
VRADKGARVCPHSERKERRNEETSELVAVLYQEDRVCLVRVTTCSLFSLIVF